MNENQTTDGLTYPRQNPRHLSVGQDAPSKIIIADGQGYFDRQSTFALESWNKFSSHFTIFTNTCYVWPLKTKCAVDVLSRLASQIGVERASLSVRQRGCQIL